jgi:hypothetical protein
MTFQRCFQFVVATTVFVSALSLCGQTMRNADMDTGTSITSLTTLHSHHGPASSLGAIDATANSSVALDVSMAGYSSISDATNLLQSGRAGGRSVLSGSMLSHSVSPNQVQSKNLWGVKRSVALANASSVLSSSAHTLHSASPQAPRSVGARDLSGSSRPLSSLSRSHQLTLGAVAQSSHSQELASDRSPDDAFSLKMDATPDESSTMSADKQEATGFFEAVEAPIGDELKPTFGGGPKHFGMERVCGDACPLETSSDAPERAAPSRSGSAHSIGPHDHSALRLYAGSATLQAPTHGLHRFHRGASSGIR